jgi:hypothetical protein
LDGADEVKFGIEAMFQTVAAGAEFAQWGFRAGGFLGVPAIGRKLFFAYGHNDKPPSIMGDGSKITIDSMWILKGITGKRLAGIALGFMAGILNDL